MWNAFPTSILAARVEWRTLANLKSVAPVGQTHAVISMPFEAIPDAIPTADLSHPEISTVEVP